MTYDDPAEYVELPDNWPNKPLHEYSSRETRDFFGPVLIEWATQGRIRPDQEQSPITERL